MPDKGFRTLTVSAAIYRKVKSKAQQEKKSVAAYATQVLANVLEADERLSRYAPLIEVVGFQGNSIILKDRRLDRIVEVYLHQKELSCFHDSSKDCIHVSFCHALSQVSRVIRV